MNTPRKRKNNSDSEDDDFAPEEFDASESIPSTPTKKSTRKKRAPKKLQNVDLDIDDALDEPSMDDLPPLNPDNEFQPEIASARSAIRELITNYIFSKATVVPLSSLSLPTRMMSSYEYKKVETYAKDKSVIKLTTEGESKKFDCFVPGCDKKFTAIAGIKYHFENYTHEILRVLKAISSTNASVDANVSKDATMDQLESEMKKYIDPDTWNLYVTVARGNGFVSFGLTEVGAYCVESPSPGKKSASSRIAMTDCKIGISEGASSKVRSKSKSKVVEETVPEDTESRPPEIIAAQNILRDAITDHIHNFSTTIPVSKVRQISDARNDLAVDLEIKEGGKAKCPVTTCDREFGTQAGLSYHFKTFVHDLGKLVRDIEQHQTGNSTNNADSASVDERPPPLSSLLNILQNHSANTDSATPFTEFQLTNLAVYIHSKSPKQVYFQIGKISVGITFAPVFTPKRSSGSTYRPTSADSTDDMRMKRDIKILSGTKPVLEMLSVLGDPILVKYLWSDVCPRTSMFQAVRFTDALEYLPPREEIKVKYESSSQRINLPLFTGKVIPDKERKQLLLNTGVSVWALDWCGEIQRRDHQYIAVAGYKNKTEHQLITKKQQAADYLNEETAQPDEDLKNCIQIWSAGELTKTDGRDQKSREPRMKLCLVHDWGRVLDLKWMPYGGYQNEEVPAEDGGLPRLGILAAAFGDGGFRVMVIPQPQELRKQLFGDDAVDPVNLETMLYVKCTKVIFEGILPNCLAMRVSWGGINRLSVGCSNGDIIVYDVNEIFQKYLESERTRVPNNFQIEPITYISAHNSCVRSIQYIPASVLRLTTPTMSKMAHYTAQNVLASDPIKIEATISTTDYHEAAPRVQVQIVDPPSLLSQHLMITSGNDGRLFLRDMRSIFNPMLLYRVRGFVTSCAWAANYGAVVFADGTNTVRYMVLGDQTGSSITEDDTMNYRTMAMLVFSANVWCLDVSSYLPFAAACGADGAVRIGNVKRCELGLRRGIPQFDLYKLSWNTDSNEFKMSTCKETKANTKQYGVILEPDEIAIHKISWCPNRSCASFLASGGRSGLVKIESVFHG